MIDSTCLPPNAGSSHPTADRGAALGQDGGCQIEYEDQDRRVHDIFLKELAKTGAKSKMSQFVDESAYAKTSA
mgnify:CR=1 FL=1